MMVPADILVEWVCKQQRFKDNKENVLSTEMLLLSGTPGRMFFCSGFNRYGFR